MLILRGAPVSAQKMVSPSTTPNQQSPQQQVTPDKRGTADEPFIVKQKPPGYSEEERDQNREKNENDRKLVAETADLVEYTKKLYGATIAVAVVTGLLWIFTGLMWLTTRRAVRDGERAIRAARRTAVASVHQARAGRRHADIAERTLVGLERPYIFLGTLTGALQGANDLATMGTRPTGFRIEFNLDNKGRTPAIIRAVNRKIRFERALAFDDPPYDYAATIYVTTERRNATS